MSSIGQDVPPRSFNYDFRRSRNAHYLFARMTLKQHAKYLLPMRCTADNTGL
jgi:hypothetical protein